MLFPVLRFRKWTWDFPGEKEVNVCKSCRREKSQGQVCVHFLSRPPLPALSLVLMALFYNHPPEQKHKVSSLSPIWSTRALPSDLHRTEENNRFNKHVRIRITTSWRVSDLWPLQDCSVKSPVKMFSLNPLCLCWNRAHWKVPAGAECFCSDNTHLHLKCLRTVRTKAAGAEQSWGGLSVRLWWSEDIIT